MVGEITNGLPKATAKDSGKTAQNNPSGLDRFLTTVKDELIYVDLVEDILSDSKGQDVVLKIEIPNRNKVYERFSEMDDGAINNIIISRAARMAETIDDIEKRGIMRQVLPDIGVSLVFSTRSKSDQFIPVE